MARSESENQRYLPFVEILEKTEKIIHETTPELWWRKSTRRILDLKKETEKNPQNYPAETVDFIENNYQAILDVLKNEQNYKNDRHDLSNDREFISLRTVEVVHSISDYLDKSFYKSEEIVEDRTQKISMTDILKSSPRFRLIENNIFQIYSIKQDKWFSFPLPKNPNILHKGGLPRVVLKILAQANEKIIEAELPPNDFDVIASGNSDEIICEAREMGVDSQGVELVHNIKEPMVLLENRDISLNSCFMGKDYLVFTKDAFRSAQTGEITVKGRRKGIYGADVFEYDGIQLIKNRGLMRMIKALAEDKAISFEVMPLNKQQDLGIYWLVLARKFSSKENFKVLMEKVFYLSQQLGQVKENEKKVFDVLERIHQEYPLFDFNSAPLDVTGSALWLTRKLRRQIDKIYKNTYFIKSELELIREEGDEIPYKVSTEGFVESKMTEEEFREKWNKFVKNCKNRKTKLLEEQIEAEND